MSELWRRWRMLLGRHRWRQELDEEMSLHRELRRDDKRFGNELQLRERSQDMWGWRWLETLGQDIKHGARLLARTPVATGLALVSLALGIGANAALFSLMNAIMLRPLPVVEPQQLVHVMTQTPNAPRASGSFTNPMWEQVRDHQQEFSGAFAWSSANFHLNRGGMEQDAPGVLASGAYFTTLGVMAERGRLLGPSDDNAQACRAVADISDGFWQSHFGGRADALGSQLSLSGHDFEVIGILPPGFFGVDVGMHLDVAVPLCAQAVIQPHSFLQVRDAWWLDVGARLKPGQTVAAAQAQLRAQMPAWLAASVPPGPDWTAADQQRFLARRAVLEPMPRGLSFMQPQYGLPLEIMLGVAGLVLLVACANLAGLMLARAMARKQELATRLAMGASRARLVRQLLTESLLLATAGAAMGAGLASWACAAMQRFWSTPARAVQLNLHLDGTVLAFMIGLTLATAVLVGLVPALRATKIRLAAGAREGALGGGAAGRKLAAVQIAVSLLLLASAGLFLRSFVNLTHLDLGFDPAQVSLVEMDAPTHPEPPSQLASQRAQILAGFLAAPGVEAAAESFMVPTSGLQWDNSLFAQHASIPDTYFNAISPSFFNTLRTPMLAGRDIASSDGASAPAVIVLNRTAASILFPDGKALGQRVWQSRAQLAKPTQVIGIVADAKYDSSLRAEAPPTAYYPAAQLLDQFPTTSFEIRSSLPAATLDSELRAVMARMDPNVSYTLGALANQVAGNLKPERLLAVLSVLFGGLALLLTAIGLYGLAAYSSNRRRREYGVRMALGAESANVVRLALGEFAATLAWGAAGGLVATWLLARALQARLGTLLFGLAPTDALTLGGAAALLIAAALAAAWLPARRASHADPMIALRED